MLETLNTLWMALEKYNACKLSTSVEATQVELPRENLRKTPKKEICSVKEEDKCGMKLRKTWKCFLSAQTSSNYTMMENRIDISMYSI